MASIRKRTRKDGTTAYAVLYEIDGRQTSDTLTDLKSAERFRDMVNTLGGARAREIAGFGQLQRHHVPEMTVKQWLDRYVDGRTGVTKTTLYDYRSYVRNDIAPRLGDIPLSKLSRDDIEGWVEWLTREQTRFGERFRASGKTIANKHGFLSAALNRAVKDHHIPANPAAGTRLPRTERPDMVLMTKTEFAVLLSKIPTHWQGLVEFLVASGARFGEATALKPADVDRVNNTVRIVRAWKRTYAKGGYELGPPKTKRSVRTINIAATVLDKLDYMGEWLFTTKTGGPVRVSNFRTNVWWPAINRAGLEPRPRIHDLRHTHASWLIQAGKPLPVIQRRLGHESITVTVDTYGHLDRSDDAAAANAIGDILNP